jgi:hypothetical protein
VRDLEINTIDNVITAGTFGRGVWQSSLSVSTPVTEIALLNIDSGTSGISCGTSDVVLEVENRGQNDISQVQVDYVLNGIAGNTSINQLIPAGTNANLTISNLNLAVGANQFAATITTNGDTFVSNNFQTGNIFANGSGIVNQLYDLENEDMLTAGTGGSSVWQRGVPNGSLLNAASSGANVYGTNLDGNYPDETVGFLYSGCYDISGYDNVSLDFDMAYDLEFEWDILYVMYSVDGGANWSVLGSANDANWYNNAAAAGQNNRCFNCVGAQWTGRDTTMKTYSYNLDQLGNVGDIIFAWVFQSDQSVNEEGVIIDDIQVVGTLGNEGVTLDSDIVLFPNPTNGSATLKFPESVDINLKVYDLSGKVIQQVDDIQSDVYNIDLSSAASGVYLVEGRAGELRFTRKLIKQ